MSKKLGTLVKKARTENGFTQAELADMVDGLSASDIGKIERGEKEPETAVIKEMAKALGVTQVSLVSAATGSGKSSAKQTSKSSSSGSSSKQTSKSSGSGSSSKQTAKSSSAKSSSKQATKSAAKSTSSKTTSSKKTSQSGDLKLTATEKKLVQAYRKADSATKKAALGLLDGSASPLDLAAAVLAAKTSAAEKKDKEASGLESLVSSLLGGKTGGSSQKDPLSSLIENTLGNLGKRSLDE